MASIKYKRYLLDPELSVPRTTGWRHKKSEDIIIVLA